MVSTIAYRLQNFWSLCPSSSGKQLCVFHLGSGRLLHTARPHKINVRDIDYDPQRNLLATCSFDKTVKLLGSPAANS
jgi:hypothetical protein